MADDNKISAIFDLDDKEALKKLKGLSSAVEGIGGAAGSLAPLLAGMGYLAMAAIAAKVAIEAAGLAVTAVFKAEDIKAINQQFDVLASRAGLAGDAIKDAMVKAADGLADDTDLMQAANKAMIAMGSNASRLGEVMELSRKVTNVFGGDLVQTFETINTAIANGNTRMLKQYGIIIDQEKAVREYANSLGVSVDTLSQFGKQQAIMNATLQASQGAFSGVDTNVKEAQNTFKQLMVTIDQVKEVLLMAFERTMGPIIREWLGTVKKVSSDFKSVIIRNFGEGREKAEAEIENIQSKIIDLKGNIADLATGRGGAHAMGFWNSIFSSKEALIKERQGEVAELEGQLKSLMATQAEFAAKDEAKKSNTPVVTKDRSVDDALKIEQETKFQEQLLNLELQTIQKKLEQATQMDQYEEMKRQEKLLLEEQFQAQLTAIDNNKHLSKTQKSEQTAAILNAQEVKRTEIARREADQRIRVYENESKFAVSASDRFAAGFMLNAHKASKEVMDFGKLGETSFNSLSKGAANAFVALGEGSENAGDKMAGFMIGALAEIAIAQGSLLLASGLINPLNFAAGAALLVLGGVLKSLAASFGGSTKGGGMSSSATAGGGGGSDSGSFASSNKKDDYSSEYASVGSAYASAEPQQHEAQKKVVTVQVMGSYFETDQTRTRLVEMIREASDATDFKYTQVGG